MAVNPEKIKTLLFKNSSLKQTVLKNTFWLTSGTVVSRIIRAVLVILSARILGTEGYGVISYALSLAAFFGIFTDIGLSSLLTRESAKNPEKISAYLSTTFYLKLVVLAASAVIMLVASPYFTKTTEAVPLIPIMAVLLVFDSLRTFGFSVTRAKNKMEWEAGLSIATDFIITALGAFTLFAYPDPKSLAFAYTAGTGLSFILIFFALRNQLRGLLTHFDRELIRPIVTKAWPFAIMGLLGGFMINIDTVIIGIFRSAGELGLYAAAQRPVQLLYLFPSLVAAGLFPVISRLIHEGNWPAVKKAMERSMAGIFAVALPMTVGGIIIARPLIELFFGTEYIDAAFTFQLLLVTILLVFPGTLIGNAIFAHDKQRIFIFSTGTGAVVNTVLDLVLIPRYGIAGSAVATIISQLLVNVINWRYLKRVNDFNTLPHVFKISLATAVMGFLTFALLSSGVNVIVNILVSSAAFGAMLYWLKEPLLRMLSPQELLKE
jgi:O-antigen/teichoic acid export membrane protein